MVRSGAGIFSRCGAARAALGLSVAVLATSAAASRTVEQSPIHDYVRARAADADGRLDLAAQGYAAALALSPDDPVLATRAYRQAISAGDRPLALAAARRLAAQRLMPPDGRLLLLTQAVIDRDWTAASASINAIEAEHAFAFMAPILRAWVAFGSRKGDPLAILDAGRGGPLGAAYAGEHRALLLLATGKRDEGVAAVRAQAGVAGGGQVRLRLAAAALLVDKGKRSQALTLLNGDTTEIVAARELVEARKDLPAAVDSAAAGIAELFARVSLDINRQKVTPVALAVARLATFLAPDNAETWLVTGELLASTDRYQAAGQALDHIAANDPFAGSARDAKLEILVRQGEKEAALGEAEAAASKPGATAVDWIRVGDVRASLGKPTLAAEAYGKAVPLADQETVWTPLLLQGSALEEAGDWAAAKPVLERAVKVAPDQALILNLLGYAQLERRENLAGAQALIEQASRLRPDDASITDSLGWSYFLRGNVPKAITTLEKAVAGDPGETAINEHLGDAYWSAGRRFEARYAWRAALVGAESADAARLRSKIDRGWSVALAAP